ncbi:DUF6538 domain-containing protein [Sandaracinobacter neustonicus]|uniref:DUF6538 domain-containing protein n=1 Tax=Sandaracinobacter neustonicus TaxID=1715348 RepID=UPI0015E3A325|nr:DUF6538 domain-containing protein [Sandaracinobacter neustonicus]
MAIEGRPMCACLKAPSKGSAYYKFRRRVPDKLRPIIGKREWRITLETKDRAEAKSLIPDLTEATDAVVDEGAREAGGLCRVAEPVKTPSAASPAPAKHVPITISRGESVQSERESGRRSTGQKHRLQRKPAEPATGCDPVKLEPLPEAYVAETAEGRLPRDLASSRIHMRSLVDFLKVDDLWPAAKTRMIS